MLSLTIAHVVLSLAALAAGIPLVFNLLNARLSHVVTATFLATTAATSVSGFLFPLKHIGLGQVTGAISIALLLPTLIALYVRRLTGPWRWIFVMGATAVFYLNGVIAVAQTFAKVAILNTIAPSHTAPPFLLAQAALLLAFVGLGAHAIACFCPYDRRS
jgi:hypothetical protein